MDRVRRAWGSASTSRDRFFPASEELREKEGLWFSGELSDSKWTDTGAGGAGLLFRGCITEGGDMRCGWCREDDAWEEDHAGNAKDIEGG